MTKVEIISVINASPDKVWQLVSHFGDIDKYIPAIGRSTVEGEGIGAVRTLELKSGGIVKEKLEHMDMDLQILQYAIVDRGPLPLNQYVSVMQVSDPGDGKTILKWYGTFEPIGVSEKDAVELVKGLYQSGVDQLNQLP